MRSGSRQLPSTRDVMCISSRRHLRVKEAFTSISNTHLVVVNHGRTLLWRWGRWLGPHGHWTLYATIPIPHHPPMERRGEARRERAREGERERERGRLTQDDRYALPRRRRGLQRRRLSRIHITLRLGLDRHRPLHRTVCGGSSMVSNTPLREG